ncbi:MAG: hypothetical protein JWO19_2141 [Bryobacterales bacterium]|nr:hypothetical protein [Bryobacterales bacterium]
MKRRIVAMIAAMLLAAVFAASQTGPSKPATTKSYTPSRTPDGQPDFQGIWSNAILTPLERPADLKDKEFFTKEEAAAYVKRMIEQGNKDRRDGAGTDADVARAYNDFWWDRGTGIVKTLRTSLVTDPPDGHVPALTPLAQKRAAQVKEARRLHPADGPEDRPLMERCILLNSAGPPMMPSAYNNNYQVVQTAQTFVILNEMIHDARVIPLDGRPHAPNSIRLWMGDSRGHWDGNSLVIDTTNFTGQTPFRGSGENLHLTERFTRMDAETLLYEFTVDDPESFTRPWSAAIPSVRTTGPILEYACNEGNYGMTGLLSAARSEEKKDAEKRAAKGQK